MLPTLRLEATGVDPLVLDPFDGWIVQGFDWQPGAIREVVEDAPDADGTIDSTTLIGAGSVTVSMVLAAGSASLWQMRQRLKRYASPRLRPVLYVQEADDAPERRIILRASQFTDPLDDLETANVVAQWVAPFGILESAELHTATVQASGEGTESGLVAPIVAPIILNASAVQGAVQVTNAGTAPVYPLLRLYGPWSGEASIINDATGQQLVFDGENVAAGQFLEIDTRAKTIRLNGAANQSRQNRLVFPDSTWWTLQPGEQRIRFVPETFTSPAQAQIVWRDGYL